MILFILISTVITTVLYMPCVLKANLLREFFKINCKILVRYDTNYFFPNSYIYINPQLQTGKKRRQYRWEISTQFGKLKLEDWKHTNEW